MKRKIIWPILLISCFLFFIFTPRDILYPDYKFLGWIIFGLIFFVFPYLIFKTIEAFNPTKSWLLLLVAASPLIIGPGYGLYHHHLEKKELQEQGVWTNCVVIHKKYSGGKTQSWLIKCSYKKGASNFETHYHADKDNRYSIGDTLKLIYNKDYPKMYELEYEYRNN